MRAKALINCARFAFGITGLFDYNEALELDGKLSNESPLIELKAPIGLIETIEPVDQEGLQEAMNVEEDKLMVTVSQSASFSTFLPKMLDLHGPKFISVVREKLNIPNDSQMLWFAYLVFLGPFFSSGR